MQSHSSFLGPEVGLRVQTQITSPFVVGRAELRLRWDQILVGVISTINDPSVVVDDREAQGDGEESPEEESPFTWPSSRASAKTRTQEVQEQRGGSCGISKMTGGDFLAF